AAVEGRIDSLVALADEIATRIRLFSRTRCAEIGRLTRYRESENLDAGDAVRHPSAPAILVGTCTAAGSANASISARHASISATACASSSGVGARTMVF